MNFLNQLFSPGVLTPIRNTIFREAQFMLTDFIGKIFKLFLMAIFIGFLLSFILIALIYFIARQPANDLYEPTQMLKLRSNSMINSMAPLAEPYPLKIDYNRLERTSDRMNELRLNQYYFRIGDNLSEICSRFNVNEKEVRRINQLGELDAVSPGTYIDIPAK